MYAQWPSLRGVGSARERCSSPGGPNRLVATMVETFLWLREQGRPILPLIKIQMIESQFKRTLCVKLSASIAAVGVLLSAGVASAVDATAPMAVGATVAANCTISTGALAFGAYNAVAKT